MEKGGSKTTSRWRQACAKALVCLVCAAAVVLPVAIDDPTLHRLELTLGDLVTDGRGGGTVDDQFVLIGIDDDSLNVENLLDDEEMGESLELFDMCEEFPWSRGVYAGLARRLIEAGARLVVFDMTFSTASEDFQEGDEDFKAVIEEYPDRIVIASAFSEREGVEGTAGKAKTIWKFSGPDESVLESAGGVEDNRVGFATVFPDIDRKLRRTQIIGQVRAGADMHHSLAFAALKQLGLEARIEDPAQRFPIRFPDFDDSGFSAFPLYTIFFETTWEKNYQSGETFRDKIVYVGGASDVAFHDDATVPQGTILGVQLQMATLAALKNGELYSEFSRGWQYLSIAFMALIAFAVAFVMKRPLVGLGILVGGGIVYLICVRWIYFSFDILLPSATPTLTLAASGIFCFGYQFAVERLEKARLRRTLERQVSKELAEHILSMPEDYFNSLPGTRRPVTILFSDIRSFTTRSEKDDPVELVEQLGEYLDAMAEVVFKHHGVVDKFIGDAVMAVWGNIRSEGVEVDARNAVAAAVEMLERLDELNRNWVGAGREPFAIGIGLNHGESIFAMMGSERKQEMTVIGDPVNQAARLEGLTKKFGVGIIVGEQVAEYVKSDFHLRSLGPVRTKGKEEAAELFGVLGRKSATADRALAEKLEWVEEYHKALEAFQKGDDRAAEAQFQKCQSDDPSDLVCALYLEHLAKHDADRALRMTEK